MYYSMLLERISSIFKKISYAALRTDRNPEEIKLIAVTKSQPIDKIIEAADLGLRIFGENRVQEAKEKIERIKGFNIEWHMIGHLQTNKVREAVKLFTLIHSLDSEKLAIAIDKESRRINKIQRVLVQVKLSHEESKYGVEPEELERFLHICNEFENIKIEGLMTIPPYFKNPEDVRPYFRKLKQLRDKVFDRYPFIKQLSMGMSHDYEVAIEEGATMVRIGTALFGQRRTQEVK